MRAKLLWIVGMAFIIGMMITAGMIIMIAKGTAWEPIALVMVLSGFILSIFADRLFRQVANSLPAE